MTFLFTDIEGSTRLLRALDDDYHELLAAHHEMIRRAADEHGGIEVSTEGDAFFMVWTDATMAVSAAVQSQRWLMAHEGPQGSKLRVRMGLHTGTGTLSGGDYVGIDVHRAARIAAAAHGGQVLLSQATALLVERSLPYDVSLVDLGKHRLKDLGEPETLFQLRIKGLEELFPPLRSLEAVRHNLPVQVTSFVGREKELRTAARLLANTRLLTMTGPGGTGKTRLAVHLAAEVAEQFPDGVFFVPLAAVFDPDRVPSAILDAIGVIEHDHPPVELLPRVLGPKELLLVLDNFEQIRDRGAHHVAQLLQAAPKVKILVTSRIPLHVIGEQEMPIPPLQVDGGNAHESEGVRLFTERAAAVMPGFRLTDDNIDAIIRLVDHLDGLPLAIELAAAQVKMLRPQDILQRLDMRRLATSEADRPVRHRTLWNTISWSYELLGPSEQRLFRHLAVFAGGTLYREFESVCSSAGTAESELLDVLTKLVDHSLVQRRDGVQGPRFHLLRVIREFASAHLDASGESEEVRIRHALSYALLAEEAAAEMLGGRRVHWLDVIRDDHDNIRSALRWAIATGAPDVASRLVWGTWRYWQARGYLHEGAGWAAKVVAMSGAATANRVRALEAQGGLAWWMNDMDLCMAAYEEAHELAQRLGMPNELARAKYNLALVLGFSDKDPDRAVQLFDEGEALYTKTGNESGLGDIAWGRCSFYGYGSIFEDMGDRARVARHYAGVALEHYKRAGNRFGFGWANHDYGETSRELGEYDTARSHLLAGLQIFSEDHDISGVVLFLNDLASLAVAEGDQERAVRLSGAVHGLRIESGTDLVMNVANQPEGLDFDTLEAMTGPLADAYREGRAMTMSEAVAYATEAESPVGV